MYTLRFSNSARPNFPPYKRSHPTLDSVALEILRVREELQLDSSAAAHQPIVEDYKGNEVSRIPTASRRRDVVPRFAAPKTSVNGATTQTLTGHDIFEVIEIDGRRVTNEWVGEA